MNLAVPQQDFAAASSSLALAPDDFRSRITVLILTFNEAANIGRTLSAVAWARRIVVIDSGSTDDTVAIAKSFPQVEVFARPFDSHAAQWSFGLDKCADAEWVLALDADYVVTPALAGEIAHIAPQADEAGYRISFKYCIDGRPLKGSLYPPVVALYLRSGARYVQDGHTQRLMLDGHVRDLDAPMLHDDRKPLAHWLNSQLRYARLEAEKLLAAPKASLRRVDRLRRTAWAMPLLVLPYTLIAKRCILDGRAGWTYALQRLFAEVAIALQVIEQRFKSKS